MEREKNLTSEWFDKFTYFDDGRAQQNFSEICERKRKLKSFTVFTNFERIFPKNIYDRSETGRGEHTSTTRSRMPAPAGSDLPSLPVSLPLPSLPSSHNLLLPRFYTSRCSSGFPFLALVRN